MTMNNPMKVWNLRRSKEGQEFIERLDNCQQAVDYAYYEYVQKLDCLKKLQKEFGDFLGIQDSEESKAV